MEFVCDEMGNASTVMGGEKKTHESYEMQGNSINFMGQNPPPNLIGSNFTLHYFTHEMGNDSMVREREKKSDDSYEMQGNSLNFLMQNPPPNLRGTNFTRCCFTHVMGDDSTLRGKEKMSNDSYEIQGNSLNFTGQNPPPNLRGSNFTHYFIHEDSVPDFLESRKEFEPPASPGWSYHRSCVSWDDDEEPPMLPTLLGAADMYGPFSCARPHFATLGHLFIELSPDKAAIASTERFQDKYVTVVLDKPSDR